MLAPRRSDGWKTAPRTRHTGGLSHRRRALRRLLAQQAVEHHGIAAGKIRVLYPPVDTLRFSPVDAALELRAHFELAFASRPFSVSLASTGHARRSLDLAVRRSATVTSRPCWSRRRPAARTQAPDLRYLGYRDIEDVYRAVDATPGRLAL